MAISKLPMPTISGSASQITANSQLIPLSEFFVTLTSETNLTSDEELLAPTPLADDVVGIGSGKRRSFLMKKGP